MEETNRKNTEGQPLLDCRSLPYFLKEKGISCQELEEKCGFEKGTLAGVCSGEKLKMPCAIVEKAADILHTDIKNLGVLPCHNLRYYCDQRGLTCSALEMQCNFTHNTLVNAYTGLNHNMSYGKIKKAAEVLRVDIEDLGAPKEECINIMGITSAVLESLLSPPTTIGLKKRAETIAACLSQTDNKLEPYISYIIHDSNRLGRACACYVLSSSGQESASLRHKPQVDLFPAITALDWYRNQKGIKKRQLARMVELSRPTLYKYLNGQKKPGPELMDKFAMALNVDPSLLDQDYEPTLIDRSQIEEDIRSLIKKCRPKDLKAKGDLVLAYLNQLDGNMECLLNYLLRPSSTKRQDTQDVLQDMMKCSLFYRRYHKPNIHIGYCQDEDGFYDAVLLFDKEKLDKNLSFINILKSTLSNETIIHMILSDEKFLDKLLSAMDEMLSELDKDLPEVDKNLSYKILLKKILSDQTIMEGILSNDTSSYRNLLDEVLVRGTVYPLFRLPSPQQYFSSLKLSDLPLTYMDLPYQIESELSPEDDDFKSELFEQVLEAFINDVTDYDSDSDFTEILFDYLEECYENADIVEYQTWDVSKYIRCRQREHQYKQIAAKLYEDISDKSKAVEAIARTFSQMWEDPAYE